MTLIIGCITKEFGIIAGDTQLSSGDLARGEFDRIILHKVHQYGPDFVMGILGKWSFVSPMEDGTGTLIDYNTAIRKFSKLLKKRLPSPVSSSEYQVTVENKSFPTSKSTFVCPRTLFAPSPTWLQA